MAEKEKKEDTSDKPVREDKQERERKIDESVGEGDRPPKRKPGPSGP